MAQRGPVCTQSCERTQLAATSRNRRSGGLRGSRAPLALAIAAFAALLIAPAAASAQSNYTLPPTLATNQWYWEISPSASGLAGLPAVTGTYPAPGSANIWDTDMFADSNTNGGMPTGPSPVVQALHAAGKYSICYIEAGAQQAEPDSSNFAVADYQNGSNHTATAKGGWPGGGWGAARRVVRARPSAPRTAPSSARTRWSRTTLTATRTRARPVRLAAAGASRRRTPQAMSAGWRTPRTPMGSPSSRRTTRRTLRWTSQSSTA